MVSTPLMIRERIKSFYSRYEGFCNPALKFILAFVSFRMINRNINFAAVLTSLPITQEDSCSMGCYLYDYSGSEDYCEKTKEIYEK